MKKTIFSKRLFMAIILLFFTTNLFFASNKNDISSSSPDVDAAQQQNRTITCIVSDKSGPLIGVSVIVKGTTNGSMSDIDGKVVLKNVPDNAVLVASFIGYTTQEVRIGKQNTIAITLSEDTKLLDEIVVVGYGTQAKKDITGSVAVVETKALTETPVATFAEALQGRAAGVHIQSTGAPGSETTIRIRGVGSMTNSSPLVIVDGVANVDINSVNPNDIETFQVLKDAAASAIYGAQGANGVIIITTKQGAKEDKISITYDGTFGWSKMANKGFDVLNAWDAMLFQAEGMVNLRDIRGGKLTAHPQFGNLNSNNELTMPYAIKPAGRSKQDIISDPIHGYGSIENWVASYEPNGESSWSRSAYYQMLEDGYSEAEARKGTDWYDLITQTGFGTSHQLSALGGGKKGSYSLGLGYVSRQGTIKESRFERFSFRANTTFIPNKYFSVGQNTNAAMMEWNGERGGNEDDTVFARTYTTQPWIPVYNVGGDFAGSQATEGGRSQSPVHQIDRYKNNFNRRFFIQNALFAEIKPIEGLTLRTQFSTRFGGHWRRDFWSIDIFANKEGQSDNSLEERGDYWLDWQWTNTVNYQKVINKDHNIQVLVGTEAIKNGLGRWVQARKRGYVFENDPSSWSIKTGTEDTQTVDGEPQQSSTMLGFFTRADYSYQHKYLTTLTVRRDGSSRFSPRNRWGTFPSISLGWRISSESFFENTKEWLDDLKIRGGYGTTGNSLIGEFNYAFRYGTGADRGYPLSGYDFSTSTGYVLTNLGDVNAKWETTKMLNLGFDATFLNNRLTLNMDYYIKKTSDMLLDANWSALSGWAEKPKINIGDMENKGIDFGIGWRDKIGDLSYNISANISTYKNKVVKLGSSDILIDTRINDVTITTPGQPIGMYYGYKIDGIYTSKDDVLNYKGKNGETILPYVIKDHNSFKADDWVGRYKIRDVNGDGRINEGDRTFIGNPHPDFTGGLNIGLNYKGFDLSTYLYFSVGNDLYKQYMLYTHFGALQSNYSYDRWKNSFHPTKNPNGKYPLWATSSADGPESKNESNSTYVQDGSYLRMQTLTLGYTLPKVLTQKAQLQKVRFYAQMSNVFTITGYEGLDPEVRSSDDRRRGIDYGSYGMPRTFSIGVNVGF